MSGLGHRVDPPGGLELAGPRETFDKDLPVMLAMTNSFKTNDEVVRARTRQNLDAQNRRFAALQQARREQVDAFDRYNRAWERRATEQSRSAADFDEVIRGYRTVEDTRTGDRTSVDLGNAHDIVEKLNKSDPGRYKEIPLRDELYSLEGKRAGRPQTRNASRVGRGATTGAAGFAGCGG